MSGVESLDERRWATVLASVTTAVRSPCAASVAALADELAGVIGATDVAVARSAPEGRLAPVRSDDAQLIERVESSGTAREALASGGAVAGDSWVVVPVLCEARPVGVLVVAGSDGDLDMALVTTVAELCGWVLAGEPPTEPLEDLQEEAAAARSAQEVAERDRDVAHHAQALAESARQIARRAQELAESDRDTAIDALEVAEVARDVARRAQRLAESDRLDALDALEMAETARDEAVLVRDVSVEDAKLNADTAAVLVRTVLPAQLPTLRGASLAAHYAPATVTGIVGGDWYDAMVLPDGRLFCTVGDATGHGLPAATVMGRLANAARVAALLDPSPAAIVAVLNQALRADDADEMATALVAVYDPGQRTLRWARAGHTPPVIARPHHDTTILEPAAWPPLGVPPRFVTGAPPEHEIHLPPGSVCALFTDGLVERRGESIDDGLARVATALDGMDGAGDADRIAAHVIDTCAPVDTDDDVCLLVLATT